MVTTKIRPPRAISALAKGKKIVGVQAEATIMAPQSADRARKQASSLGFEGWQKPVKVACRHSLELCGIQPGLSDSLVEAPV